MNRLLVAALLLASSAGCGNTALGGRDAGTATEVQRDADVALDPSSRHIDAGPSDAAAGDAGVEASPKIDAAVPQLDAAVLMDAANPQPDAGAGADASDDSDAGAGAELTVSQGLQFNGATTLVRWAP